MNTCVFHCIVFFSIETFRCKLCFNRVSKNQVSRFRRWAISLCCPFVCGAELHLCVIFVHFLPNLLQPTFVIFKIKHFYSSSEVDCPCHTFSSHCRISPLIFSEHKVALVLPGQKCATAVLRNDPKALALLKMQCSLLELFLTTSFLGFRKYSILRLKIAFFMHRVCPCLSYESRFYCSAAACFGIKSTPRAPKHCFSSSKICILLSDQAVSPRL